MWLCVVITFSIVGYVWFGSISHEYVTALNPGIQDDRALAQVDKDKTSAFGTVSDSLSNLGANISSLLGFSDSKAIDLSNGTEYTYPKVLPRLFPIPKDKK